MTGADVHALIGAYVLDAVDDLERAAFDRHLSECAACRAEVDELRAASARLADGAWSVPPPALRTQVMAAIGSVAQLPPARVTPPRSPRRRLVLTAAAAAVVLAAAGAVAVVQTSRVRDEHARAETAEAASARLQALLTAPDLVVKESPVTGGGRVTVATSRLHDAGVIMLAAAAAPTGGRVYQLWTIRSAVPVPEGTLPPGRTTSVQIVAGMDAASAVGVSVEPPGGSPKPTMPLVAAVEL
ncbi:anti-sigma factor [Actinoplanes sp. CA-030573]|uniref:anti-sigma factor n=1 Tax=Actinoplanes sp. CA-030573 TaxID=3239898 RepID=UPI003D91E08C